MGSNRVEELRPALYSPLPPCVGLAARGPAELLLQLERRDGLLRPGALLLPRCLRLQRPEPRAAAAELRAGLHHGRVSMAGPLAAGPSQSPSPSSALRPAQGLAGRGQLSAELRALRPPSVSPAVWMERLWPRRGAFPRATRHSVVEPGSLLFSCTCPLGWYPASGVRSARPATDKVQGAVGQGPPER